MLDALRTRTNLVLLAALALALVLLVLLLTVGTKAVGVTSDADAEQHRIDAVTSAARTEIAALFGADYRQAEAWEKSVTDGATGEFLDQLQTKLPTNKAAIVQGQIVAHVDVTDVGINDLKGDTAVVYAAADETESSPSTTKVEATPTCTAATLCHQYVLKVGLVRTPAGWKVSSLGMAG